MLSFVIITESIGRLKFWFIEGKFKIKEYIEYTGKIIPLHYLID